MDFKIKTNRALNKCNTSVSKVHFTPFLETGGFNSRLVVASKYLLKDIRRLLSPSISLKINE